MSKKKRQNGGEKWKRMTDTAKGIETDRDGDRRSERERKRI